MKVIATQLAGLLVLQPKVHADERGCFVKTYSAGRFQELGIPFEPREQFFTTSRRGVIRGMHFQIPPAAQAKLVYCAAGAVLDAVADLRRGSPTYGQYVARELSSTNREMLFIPLGFAHGFLSLADQTILVYQTSTVHSPPHDAGILWNSFGLDWPATDPILSARDRGFPSLERFASPF